MNNDNWTRWIMQTARTWPDIAKIIRSTGVDAVDHDHRQLLEYALELNQLIEHLNKDKFNLVYLDDQRHLLNNLYQYTEHHFGREEKLMKQYHIPDTAYHLEQHKEILAMLQHSLAEFDAGKITVSENLKLSILEWVVNHINEIDNKTFALANWEHVLVEATCWDDVKAIIKRTEVEVVDNEHRLLVETSLKLNSVIEMADKTTQIIKAREVLKELEKVVMQHFTDEEAFLSRYGLSGLQTQQQQHESFRTYLQSIMATADDELVAKLQSFKVAIMEWWINHINKLDFNSLSLTRQGQTIIDNADTPESLYCMIRKTGMKQVDSEHLKLINLTMALTKLFSDKAKKDTLPEKAQEVFNDVVRFAAEHFKHEEALMKEQNNPLYEAHRSEHRHLLNELDIIQQQYEKGLITFSKHLQNQLINWWVNHTNKIDIETFGEATCD